MQDYITAHNHLMQLFLSCHHDRVVAISIIYSVMAITAIMIEEGEQSCLAD